MAPHSLSLLPLYRSYLRQIRLLPHIYLRHFFQIRAREDIEAIRSTHEEELRNRRAYSVHKRIRRIEKANNGNLKAFDHILDLAYGRVGKLKWELLEPLLSDPTATIPEPIIPGVEKSRPPIYSPELKALLTSALSRSTKPLDRADLTAPRTLPARADPSSEEARLFGPLSKRREVNIRWRFFRTGLTKVLPPLEIEGRQLCDNQSTSVSCRPLAIQNQGIIRDIQNLIGDLFVERPKTRRERGSNPPSQDISATPQCVKRHPSRWVRRRYRALLSRIPQLVYDPKSTKEPFSVRTFPLAHYPQDRKADRMRHADPTVMAWVEK
ncbi:hypothetical protein CPB84DRAFT_1760183 [Gymnopilus junonius]|uniref:LYR motif-containing protein Cup1-like N-terminal domain-containing protein n=1 Tax=Gymnopilus junonius TaxID=109634 RepID=A0A9P5TV97_GYMJU|nr:hypothetical protein CPB84DRAFT_1760183 [Gymnopilus junonius]